MSLPDLVCGPVRVRWLPNGSVGEITYRNEPFSVVVSNMPLMQGSYARGFSLSPPFQRLVVDMLTAIERLPSSEAARKVLLATRIFENLVIETPLIPNPKLKGIVSELIMREVWQWEDANEQIHKGTPYYFMAKDYLEQGDIPSAYIYFFNALEEDRRNFSAISQDVTTGGAYLTTSLVDNPIIRPHLYESVVVPLRNYLQRFINEYNRKTRKTRNRMTLQTLDQKLLQSASFKEVNLLFVATIHEIFHLAPLNSPRMIKNDYSKLKVMGTLFNLSLIADQLLEHRLLTPTTPRRERKMGNAVYRLALHLKWTSKTLDRRPEDFLRRISPNMNSGLPDTIVPLLLNGRVRIDGHPVDSRTPKKLAILLAYHLRNFGAHHIQVQNVLVNKYPEILGRMMDAILTVVEIL